MSASLFARTGHHCDLPHRAAVLGTDPQCDVPLTGQPGVAPRHCELRPTSHGMELVKLDPVVVLLANGAPVTSALLHDNDVITVGSLELLLRVFADPEEPSPDAAEDSLEGFSEAEKQKRRAQQLMQQNWQRTQGRYEEFRRRQNFPLALAGAVLGIIVGAAGFSLVSGTIWRAYIFLIIAVGFVIGWIIRLFGRGVDRRFGFLGAVTAILGVVASTGFDAWTHLKHGGVVPHQQETSPEEAARLEQRRKEDEARAAMIAAEAAEMDKIGRRKLDENDPFNILDAKRNEDIRFRDEVLAKATVPTVELHALGFLLLLLGPKHLAAYLLAGIAAYRASFRYLSNVEASNLHGNGREPPAEDRAGSLRERIELRP
jgi:hypothetical protein